MEALGLIVHLKQEEACVESFGLFHTVAAAVDEHSDRLLWHPVELSLVGAFNWDGFRPWVGDPSALVRILRLCLLEQDRGMGRDGPIENIMFALAAASADEIGKGLAEVDFTEPLFFNGICRALRENAPYRLRRATVIFLRHLDTQLFGVDILKKGFSNGQINALMSDWSASAKESWDTKQHPLLRQALVTTLLGLLDSPFWRKFIPSERWDMLKLLGGIDDELVPPSLYRCLKNTNVIEHLLRIHFQGSAALTLWIALLWAKYPDLSDYVRNQLRRTTERMVGSPFSDNLGVYLSILEREMERVRRKIDSPNSWPFGMGIVELREKREMLKEKQNMLRVAREKLDAIIAKSVDRVDPQQFE